MVIDGNTLRFFIRHTNPMHRPNTYLTMLKAHVDRIVEKMGLKPPACQLIYKLDGKRDVFDFEILKLRLEVGQTHELAASHRKMIPIADILNQSAPDGLEDEQNLLDAIKQSCHRIQAEPDYYLKQGETGRGVGELDLLIYNDRKEPWTIIEALLVFGKAKTEWDKHLDKLVANYNYFGAPCVYLLTYVDADAAGFKQIWESYQLHVPKPTRENLPVAAIPWLF